MKMNILLCLVGFGLSVTGYGFTSIAMDPITGDVGIGRAYRLESDANAAAIAQCVDGGGNFNRCSDNSIEGRPCAAIAYSRKHKNGEFVLGFGYNRRSDSVSTARKQCENRYRGKGSCKVIVSCDDNLPLK